MPTPSGGAMAMAEMQVELPYLSEELDRHGNLRLYVRRNGRRIRLRVARGTDGFLDAYRAALDSLRELMPPSPTPPKKIAPRGSLGWLASLYFGSEEFKKLTSGPTRRAVIEECLRETVRDKSDDLMSDCPLTYVTPAKIKRLRDLKQGLPGAANNRRKYLSAMFGWAVEEGHLKTNPARDVRRIKYATSGFHTWTVAEVALFIERHPIGTKPYLALCLLLFTGMRSGDMVKLGKQHSWRGLIRFIPGKTKHVRMDISEKPILPPLTKALEAGPTGDLTFLETQYRKPFTTKGFGNWFRDRCNEAGLPHCTAHGLRKAGATIAAENGATTAQLMAIYDWSTPSQAEVYIRAANRTRLAGQAMPLLAKWTEQESSIVAPDSPTLSHPREIK
jgi:integrase